MEGSSTINLKTLRELWAEKGLKMTLLATFAQLHQISQVASWCYIPTINLTREEMSGKRLCERSLSATLGKFHRPFSSDNSHSFCNTTKQKSRFDCSKYSFFGKTSIQKKTFSFGHCPNHLKPPPDPNSGNLVLFFRSSNFKISKSV